MRLVSFGAALAAAALAQADGASGKTAPARRAEVIDLVGGTWGVASADLPPTDAAPAASDTEPFASHDLSRKWVAFQMAEQIGAGAGSRPSVLRQDSDAWRADLVGEVPRAAILTVPAWMRPGTALPSSPALIPAWTSGCAPLAYRPTGFLAPAAEQRRASLFGLMSSIACEHRLPAALFDALIIRESRYRVVTASGRGAFGLTQLMPGTASDLGVDRYGVEDNLRGGARYLRQQLDRFGEVRLALAAYNAGPKRVSEGTAFAIRETRDYVDNVLFNWSRLAGAARFEPLPARDLDAGRRATITAW